MLLFVLLLPLSVSSQELAGWQLLASSSWRGYLLLQSPMSWAQAEDACQALYGHLARDDPGGVLREYLELTGVGTEVWVGLHQPVPQQPFRWVDEFSWLSGWEPGERAGLYRQSLCIALNPAQDYRWDTRYCEDEIVAAAVCQIEVPRWLRRAGQCELGRVWRSDGRLLYFPDNETLLCDCQQNSHIVCTIEDPVAHQADSCCFLSNQNRETEEENEVDLAYEQIFRKSGPKDDDGLTSHWSEKGALPAVNMILGTAADKSTGPTSAWPITPTTAGRQTTSTTNRPTAATTARPSVSLTAQPTASTTVRPTAITSAPTAPMSTGPSSVMPTTPTTAPTTLRSTGQALSTSRAQRETSGSFHAAESGVADRAQSSEMPTGIKLLSLSQPVHREHMTMPEGELTMDPKRRILPVENASVDRLNQTSSERKRIQPIKLEANKVEDDTLDGAKGVNQTEKYPPAHHGRDKEKEPVNQKSIQLITATDIVKILDLPKEIHGNRNHAEQASLPATNSSRKKRSAAYKDKFKLLPKFYSQRPTRLANPPRGSP